MSLSLIVWLVVFPLLAFMAFHRPVWGVTLYMFTFFAHPSFWWWGTPIETYRWNLFAGIVLLCAIFAHGRRLIPTSPVARKTTMLGLAMLANAAAVHFLLAPSAAVSSESFLLMAKFLLLFLMIMASVKDRDDLRWIVVSIAIGVAYLGYEIMFNQRGAFRGGRLLSVGAPGADDSNELASLLVTVIPLIGSLCFIGNRWQKVLGAVSAGLGLNAILLCNSRAAFLALLLSAMVLLVAAPKSQRRKAWAALGLGVLAAYFLLGDARIVERFWTTFASAEERDHSASERLIYWRAGANMIADRPLGSGGHGFKKVYGGDYLKQVGSNFEMRSVHNGFINEACEWGVQGLALRLAFVGTAILFLIKVLRRHVSDAFDRDAFFGLCLIASTSGFLVTCLFNDALDAEWGYWTGAMMLVLAKQLAEETRWAYDCDLADADANDVLWIDSASGIETWSTAADR